jgi:hypothetical protein
VVFDVDSLEASERINTFPQHIAGTFVGAFGLLALVLAAVGIYAVTAYTTRQRMHEIGIRMALGASKDDILRLVLGHGLRLVFAGVVVGRRPEVWLLVAVMWADALLSQSWTRVVALVIAGRASTEFSTKQRGGRKLPMPEEFQPYNDYCEIQRKIRLIVHPGHNGHLKYLKARLSKLGFEILKQKKG